MSAIKHTQLFDFDSYSKAIKDVETQTNAFGKSVDETLKRLVASQGQLTGELREYVKFLQAMNVTQAGARETLKKYNDEIDATIAARNSLKQVEKGNAQIIDLTKASVVELKAEYTGLKKQYDSLKPAQADFAARQAEIKKRVNEVVPLINAQANALKVSKQAVDFVEGSYTKLNAELVGLKAQLKNMPGAFDPATGAINRHNKEAVALIDTIQKRDAALKAADASMGQHFRNVGNYASGYNGLANSINQLTREAPAFAVSMSTGFLALSNNLPILVDEINRLKVANVELAASGQKPVSVLKQLGSAIFSWQTLISVSITLLTVYGAKFFEWVGTLFKGKEALDSLKESQNLLNKALSGTEYSNAIKQINELKINVDLAKKGFIDKRDVVDQYNTSIGKTTGQVKSLDEVEQFLVKNADAYIKMTLYKAAANLALEEASKKAFEAEQTRRKKEDDFIKYKDRVDFSISPDALTSTYTRKEAEAQRTKIAEGRRKEQIAEAEKDRQVFEDIAKKFQQDAAKLSQDNNFSFFDGGKGNDLKEGQKAAKEALELLKDRISEGQKILKSALEYDQLENQSSLDKKAINQQQFEETKYQLSANYAKAAIDLELQLGKHADKARIQEYKNEQKKALNELEKFNNGQFAAMREKGRVKAEPEQTKSPIAELALKGLDSLSKGYDDYYQRQINNENEAFELLKARKDATFEEEFAHLERIKRINEEAANAIGLKNLKLSEKYAEQAADAEILAVKLKEQRKKAIEDEWRNLAQQAAQAGFQILKDQFNADREERIASLENEKQRELTAAGNNAAAKEKIENEFNQRISKEKTRQAKQDRLFSLFSIAIDTAKAVAKAVAVSPQTFGLPFSAFALAQGAIQAAVVAAKPIPAFRTGTRNAPKGHALVAEEGYELIERNGKMLVTPGKPSIIELKGGEKIFTHHESQKIIERSFAAQEIKQIINTGLLHERMAATIQQGKRDEQIFIMQRSLGSGNISEEAMQRAFERALKTQPVERNVWDQRGYQKYLESQNERIAYQNKRYSS